MEERLLQNLHVKNLALIKEADVDFKDGLNILTGETGAGKSIIIGSVSIALGQKIPKDIVRKDANFGLVELIFSMGEKEKQILKENDLNYEEENLIISRKITNGRSTIKINGETVTLAVLKNVSKHLIDIHGQHDHQSLLYETKHLEILDEYATEKLEKIKNEVKQLYKQYTLLKKEWNEFEMDEEERLRQVDFLQFEIQEIEDANLKEGEDTEVEELFKKMSGAKKTVEALSEAYGILENEDAGISDLIGRAIRAVSSVSESDGIKDIYAQLLDIESLIKDAALEMDRYISDLDFDEQQVYETEQRLDTINKLKSKYGQTIQAIMQYKQEKEEKLQKLIEYDQRKKESEKEIESVKEKLLEKSEQLSGLRKEAAKELEKNIIDSLKELNFLDVKFQIAFQKKDHFTEDGMDAVSFQISTNPGETLKPLSKVASGGELSRIMLAIKTILAKVDQVHTLIFDEIDTGISGRTAQAVAEKLGRLAKHCQIICITHLPQIAAMADKHFLIEKNTDHKETITKIEPLSNKQRVEEMARILGGAQITDAVRKHAKEMLLLAEQVKS